MHDLRVRSALACAGYQDLYDVNVLALFHYGGRHQERVRHFKTLGLVNRGACRVHVLAVCSLGDGKFAQEIAAGWPKDVDVTVLEMCSNHPVPKINGAYLWLKDQPIRARWELRVDDDSVTDVSRLLAQQEARFGSAAVHLMSCPQAVPKPDGLEEKIDAYLREKGYRAWSLENEYEASLTSRAAMRRIHSSTIACRFLADMAATHEGPGDKCLAIAARLADVPTAVAFGMDNQFDHANLSVAGGRKTHIHYVDWNNARFSEMLAALEYGKRGALSAAEIAAVRGRQVEFGRCVGSPIRTLTLQADGTVFPPRPEQSRWRMVCQTLWIQNERDAPTTVFSGVLSGSRRRWFIGFSTVDPQMHYLALPCDEPPSH